MKKVFFTLTVLSVSVCLSAQTTMPDFSKLGYKKQVMYTSSKGEFEEFHDQTGVVEIGSVLFNTKTNQVVGFVSEEKEDEEVSATTAAMSIDPLCEKYYWISPYAYCLNNPIRYSDPTGKFPIETIWDIGNVLYDVGAAVVNHIKGDHTAAVGNWTDLGLDAAAVVIPYVPAGATKVLKAADKAVDVGKAVDKTTDAAKVSKYSDVPNPKNVKEGGSFTKTQKQNILEANKQQNGGKFVSDESGKVLDTPAQSKKGQKANMNQAEIDHIQPKSKGGTNSSSNAQVLSKEENLRKGNKYGN
jgi:hypothetical protein